MVRSRQTHVLTVFLNKCFFSFLTRSSLRVTHYRPPSSSFIHPLSPIHRHSSPVTRHPLLFFMVPVDEKDSPLVLMISRQVSAIHSPSLWCVCPRRRWYTIWRWDFPISGAGNDIFSLEPKRFVKLRESFAHDPLKTRLQTEFFFFFSFSIRKKKSVPLCGFLYKSHGFIFPRFVTTCFLCPLGNIALMFFPSLGHRYIR